MSDLWKAYAASSTEDGREYGHTYYCATQDEAEGIAKRNGWRFDGEIVDVLYISEEEIAMMEKARLDQTLQ